MRRLIETGMKFRFIVLGVAAVMMVVGIGQLRSMPVDVLPEFSPPYVEIQTEALGLSAEEVRQMITVPMEQDLLAGVAWANVIQSESVPGLSSVLIFFEPGTDLYRARQMVSERLSQAAVGLPHVSKPPTMIQPLSSASRFVIVGLSSQELSLIEISVLARWTIGPRLMAVPGVANVATWGLRDRQLQVQVDPERLRAHGVTLQQVVETTGNALWVSSLSYLEASTPGTGGFIDTPSQRLGVWHVLPISSPEELAAVPLEGTRLLLGDVADVVEDHQPLIGDAIVEGSPTLLLVVEKLPGTNTLQVTRGVEAAIKAMRPGLQGIEFDTGLYRPATFIELATANLTMAILVSAGLLVLVLGALLYEWRSALIALVAITLSMATALFALRLQGATLNSMVLAGLLIALAVVVDEAVVDGEHMIRRLRQPTREGIPKSPGRLILEAAVEIRSTAFFSTLIILLAVLPVFVLRETPGALFRPLAISYALAVLAALAVAIGVTPGLSLMLLPDRMSDGARDQAPAGSRPMPARYSPLIAWLRLGYGRVLTWAVQRSRWAYIFAAALLVLGLGAIPYLKPKELLPPFREPYLMITLNGAPGTSRPEMNRIVTRASSELRAIPGVLDVGAHVGRAVFGDQIVGINSAEVWVRLDPATDYNETVSAIEKTVNGYAGLFREVRTYLQHRLITPRTVVAEDPLTVRIFGENLAVLRTQADNVRQRLTTIPGVVDPRVILPAEEPTLEIEVDLASAQTHGIRPGDVRRAAAVLLSGLQVGALFEEQKVFDVVVWSTPETRRSLTDVRELLIETPAGAHVRLEEVADVRMTSAPSVIRRDGLSSYLDVGFDVHGRPLDAVEREVELAVGSLEFPLEYHAEVLVGYSEQQAARQRLLLGVGVAVIGVFLLLQAFSDSWRLATAILLTLPSALVGGVLAAFLGGGTLSIEPLLGLLAVLAIAARNTLHLVGLYQRLEREGGALGPGLVLRGSQERFAPIVITAIGTGLALVPFVMLGDVPGNEIARPTTVIILGGLLTSTLFSLFVMPPLYLGLGARAEPESSKLSLKARTGLIPSSD